MITPEQQQQIQDRLKGTAPATPTTTGGSNWYASLKQQNAPAPTPAPADSPVATAIKYASGYNSVKAGYDATKDVVGGIKDTFTHHADVMNNPNTSTADRIGQQAATAIDLGSKVVDAPFKIGGAVLSANIPDWLKNAGASAVGSATDAIKSSPEAMAAWSKIHELAAAHPAITQALGGVATVASDTLGMGAGGAAKKVAEETVLPTLEKGMAGISDTVKGTKEAATSMVGKSERSLKDIQETMPAPDKANILQTSMTASDKGGTGFSRTGMFGKSGITPSPIDLQRDKLASEYIGGIKDWTRKPGLINDGIATRSQALDDFLKDKAAPSNFADMRTYIEHNNTPSTYLKDDPQAFQAYERANEAGLRTLNSTMKDSATASGDFGSVTSGADIRQARIAVDREIKNQLGAKTLSEEQFRGIKAAEMGLRNTLNRLTEDSVRYPGQLEAVNHYNRALTDLTAKNPSLVTDEAKTALKNHFGLNSTPESEAAAQKVAAEHGAMNLLYEARDNITVNNWRKLGKNVPQEMISNSPVAKAVVDTAKKALPYGVGIHIP